MHGKDTVEEEVPPEKAHHCRLAQMIQYMALDTGNCPGWYGQYESQVDVQTHFVVKGDPHAV